ncbi:hypothetical protein EZV77_24280 [Burkholderia thailandensis]|nr:hypothetical protein A8H31_23575 [Burkholderia thailandensis]AVR26745.1 hypothetical protein A8H32_18360 [Burkholderia thailandensis]AWY68817.1 hypothetical protein A8H36_28640 [Burkholderia thailandensis]MDD1483659.1 hypothetical protein [Burkholderia thailandensis]MDD1489787.1 hypothetical protein [Burkholderia thailandensis]
MRVNVFVDGIIGGVDEELMTAAKAGDGGDVGSMSGGGHAMRQGRGDRRHAAASVFGRCR